MFDAARDELGWVEQPLELDREKQFSTIVDEITFHNAIGVSQLLTKKLSCSATENPANSQRALSDVVEDPSSQEIGNHLLLTATEQAQPNGHSFAHVEPQRNVLDPAHLSGPDLLKDGPITDGAQDQMPGAWGDW